MPLLDIVGVSGMNTTLHVAQVFLRAEKLDDYRFAMEKLNDMMNFYDIPLPQVILVDCETALLNVLDIVLPTVPVLLCLWYVAKNVQKHARRGGLPRVRDDELSTADKEVKKDSEEHVAFCDAFREVVSSKTEEEYEQRRQDLHTLCKREANYIEKTWLEIWQYNLIRCWTNKATHFGLQATSRVEGYHSALKKWLVNSEGDLLTIYQRMTTWWELSIRNHKHAVSQSIVKSVRILDEELFRDVKSVIHAFALLECLDQLRRIRQTGCTGVFKHTIGLPCVHRLWELQTTNQVLKPHEFHPHWWIDRTKISPAMPPVVLVPQKIPDRRAARAESKTRKKKSHTKGSGVTGTRRDPSDFELLPDIPPLSSASVRTVEPPYMIAPITYHT